MMNKRILAVAACLATVATPALAASFNVEEATIPQIEQALRDHRLTCHALVQTTSTGSRRTTSKGRS